MCRHGAARTQSNRMLSPQSRVKAARRCEVSNPHEKPEAGKTSNVTVGRGDKRDHDTAARLVQKSYPRRLAVALKNPRGGNETLHWVPEHHSGVRPTHQPSELECEYMDVLPPMGRIPSGGPPHVSGSPRPSGAFGEPPTAVGGRGARRSPTWIASSGGRNGSATFAARVHKAETPARIRASSDVEWRALLDVLKSNVPLTTCSNGSPVATLVDG